MLEKSIKDLLILNIDNEKAIYYQKYMKNQFKFYGIPSPLRKQIIAPFLKENFSNDELLKNIFIFANGKYREEFYIAIDFFTKFSSQLSKNDIQKLYSLVEISPWWDTIDPMIKPFSYHDSLIKEMSIHFNKQESFWYKRLAILLQLKRKQNTDKDLLKEIILSNSNSNQFFIQKAIGWALREFSKTDADLVKNLLKEYKFSSLTIREAYKYL